MTEQDNQKSVGSEEGGAKRPKVARPEEGSIYEVGEGVREEGASGKGIQ